MRTEKVLQGIVTMMQTRPVQMKFHWDDIKAESNKLKHGLRFDSAVLVFSDPYRIEDQDTRRDYGEDRWKTVGKVEGDMLCVVYTVRDGDTIRIISGRYANAKEKKQYSQAHPGSK